jgi:hypothetical protein
MTASPDLLRQLSALPDWAVLTDQQTSQVLGLSVDTLRRLDRDRDGPPWVRLSPRRRGRPVGGLRQWIKQRLSASIHEPEMQASADSSSNRLVSGPNEKVDAASTCEPDAKARHTAQTGKTPHTFRLRLKDQVPP